MKIYTISGEWDHASIEKILGPPNPAWPWTMSPAQLGESVCGLSNVETESAGYGDMEACCRIHIHPEGICIHPPSGGALTYLFPGTPPSDAAYTKAIYQRLRDAQIKARSDDPAGFQAKIDAMNALRTEPEAQKETP